MFRKPAGVLAKCVGRCRFGWVWLLEPISYAQPKPLQTVYKVELDRYLGVWYEVARKPAFFKKVCL